MTEDSRLYWIWLAELFGAGSATAAALVNHFGSARDIYYGSADDLEPDQAFDAERVKRIQAKLKDRSLDRAEQILARVQSTDIRVIPCDDPAYPDQLRTIRNYPLVLYVRGKMPDTRGRLLTTIVGTRKMSDYGRKIAYSLGTGLVYGGAMVVSGMALGADSMALIGALEAGGTVIAVLGNGVDVIYPKEHREIYHKIIQTGAIVSEYPPGTPPAGRNFPVRNRIMSGLADATVVVEANQTSGALITAKHALSQGRKLFAVPGKVGDEGSEGTNALLCDSAIPAVCAEDILAEFEFVYRKTVSVHTAHAKLRNLDMDALSESAMMRARIGTREGAKNYYGSGSYGGRAKDVEKTMPTPPVEDMKPVFERTEPKASVPRVEKAEKKKALGYQFKSVREAILGSKKESKEPKIEKKTINSDKKCIPAQKIELDMLDENEIKVYNKMKPNVPMQADELIDETMDARAVLTSLTILEMAQAVESGGGGYFLRVSEDDIMQSQND